MTNISVSNKIDELDAAIKKLEQQKAQSRRIVMNDGYEPGISVIIPTSRGQAYIMQSLNSLYNQTLSDTFYEVLIVINGEKDDTEAMINTFIADKTIDNFKVEYIEEANVSSARNYGIELANREYIVFLDDDDYLSDNYLEKMYQYVARDTVTISQIINVDTDGIQEETNKVNEQIIEASKLEEITLTSLSSVTAMNACKAIPTSIVKKFKYNPILRSGEDVVFFTELFTKSNIKLNIIPIEEEVAYYRLLRDDSISRQKMTFDFYVQQRLDVVKGMDDILKTTGKGMYKQYIRYKINSQLSFVRKYLQEHPEDKERVLELIATYEFSYLPLHLIEPEPEIETETIK